MNKAMIAIICGIFLISLASAITIYSGETIYYDFTNEVDVIQQITWEVVDNTYNLEGLNITTNLTGVMVSINPLFKPDNFTIIFTITGKNEVPRDCPSCDRRTRYVEKEVEKIIGNETDEHGCLLMAGYTWCEPKQRCIRDWEEECITEEVQKPIKERLILGIIISLLLITILILISKIIKKQRMEVKK